LAGLSHDTTDLTAKVQAHEKHIEELLGLLMTPGQSADARRDLADAQRIIKELQRTRDSLSTKLFDAQLYGQYRVSSFTVSVATCTDPTTQSPHHPTTSLTYQRTAA
jgi:Trp operon repressor